MAGSDDDVKTRVDLGDDLLEKTAVLPRSESSLSADAAPLTPDDPISLPEQIEDQLESARILMNEGLLEEAKKVLRKIILADPHHVGARQRLDEIHEAELKQIFGSEDRRRRILGDDADAALSGESPAENADDVMRRLNRDLALGMLEEDIEQPLLAELSLFQNADEMEKFVARVDRDLANAKPSDRIDMGIAFLEMGFYEFAARQFRVAAQEPSVVTQASALLAHALIASGRAFDATLVLETVIMDSELKPEEKIDFLYLMGRAHERLGQRSVALAWYRQAYELDPKYRDVNERIQTL